MRTASPFSRSSSRIDPDTDVGTQIGSPSFVMKKMPIGPASFTPVMVYLFSVTGVFKFTSEKHVDQSTSSLMDQHRTCDPDRHTCTAQIGSGLVGLSCYQSVLWKNARGLPLLSLIMDGKKIITTKAIKQRVWVHVRLHPDPHQLQISSVRTRLPSELVVVKVDIR